MPRGMVWSLQEAGSWPFCSAAHGESREGMELGEEADSCDRSPDGKIRLATLELSCLLLKQQVAPGTGCIIKDVHLACLEVRGTHGSRWGSGVGTQNPCDRNGFC